MSQGYFILVQSRIGEVGVTQVRNMVMPFLAADGMPGPTKGKA